MAGSIFLDYRNEKNLSDRYNIIYGHRMSFGRMFTDIAKFNDENFFDTHRDAKLLNVTEEIDLEIIAFARVSIDSTLYRLSSRKMRDDNFDEIEKEARFYRENDERGRIYVLSTCNKESRSLRDILVLKEVLR